MKEKKDSYIQIRIEKKEKEEIQKEAKKQGFDTVSAYLLWLFRKNK